MASRPGALPDPIQHGISEVLSPLGIDVPDGSSPAPLPSPLPAPSLPGAGAGASGPLVPGVVPPLAASPSGTLTFTVPGLPPQTVELPPDPSSPLPALPLPLPLDLPVLTDPTVPTLPPVSLPALPLAPLPLPSLPAPPATLPALPLPGLDLL